MPESQSTPATPAAAPTGFGNNKGIKFNISTGNGRWTCVLQDRASYERTKTVRRSSSDSVESSSSSVSNASQ